MLASDRVLGPRWTQKELRTFYILLRAHGKQWERFLERLSQRTVAMVTALYEMHRGYLSLPEASAEGFCTIMMDHYKSIDDLLSNAETNKTENHEDTAANASDRTAVKEESNDKCDDITMTEGDLNVPKASLTTQQRKRKRKLDKILAREDEKQQNAKKTKQQEVEDTPPTNDASMETTQSDTEVQIATSPTRPSRRRRTSSPKRFRAWQTSDQPAVMRMLKGKRFDLPWYHWFYSYIDADFFAHNEFVDCLARIGLGKITRAARPVWSSVRASMGHPRRLSRFFLMQEKQKLETYRSIKKSLSPVQNPPETWPYQCPVHLQEGRKVIVYHALTSQFLLGSIAHYDLLQGSCGVELMIGGIQATMQFRLEDVMVLADDADPTHANIRNPSFAHTTTTTAVRLVDPTEHDEWRSTGRQRNKVHAMLIVKDLLRRKEHIVAALANLNQRVQTTPLSTIAAAAATVGGVDATHETMQHRFVMQHQYAWLMANLKITNRYVNAALVRLQDASWMDTPMEDPMPQLEQELRLSSGSLSVETMRWAHRFLTESQSRSHAMVKMQSNADQLSVETQALMGNCVSLMSLVRRVQDAVSSSPSNPSIVHATTTPVGSLVTLKVMERMVELLQPRHESNMDLYREVQAAIENVQTMLKTTSDTKR